MEAVVLEIRLSLGCFGEFDERTELKLLEADFIALCDLADAGTVTEVGCGDGVFRLVAEGPSAIRLTGVLREVVVFSQLPTGSRVIELVRCGDEVRERLVFVAT